MKICLYLNGGIPITNFEPKIIAFCCTYCAYVAADLAGVSRLQYPPYVRIIRVPCSGKVDLTYIFRAFEGGADAVVVAGCLEGDCHFLDGNIHAKVRVKFAKDILEAIGIRSERLEMYNISSAMAPQFAEMIREVTERTRRLGPALPKRVNLTNRLAYNNKRNFLYQMIFNLALRTPEKKIPIPDELAEFGSVEISLVNCVGCKKCEEICPEEAIDSVRELDLPTIFQTLSERKEGKITRRQRLYETIVNIAAKTPSKTAQVPDGMVEFCKILYYPAKCVMCDKCSEICPENAITITKELDLQEIMNYLSRVLMA